MTTTNVDFSATQWGELCSGLDAYNRLAELEDLMRVEPPLDKKLDGEDLDAARDAWERLAYAAAKMTQMGLLMAHLAQECREARPELHDVENEESRLLLDLMREAQKTRTALEREGV